MTLTKKMRRKGLPMAKVDEASRTVAAVDPQFGARLLLIEVNYLKLAAKCARTIAQGAVSDAPTICRDLSPLGR